MTAALSSDALAERIIGLAIDVHRHFGPGLLESDYEQCLSYELGQAGILHECQAQALLPVIYKDIRLESGFRADIRVADEVIVELKSVKRFSPVQDAQLLTYLRMTDIASDC